MVDEKTSLEVIEMSEPVTDVALPTKEFLDFGKIMEMAKMLAKSTIVPVAYQSYPENCFVAIDMAQRTGMPVMAIMQNLYVIQGKPSWSGQAMASMVRNSPQFKNVELHFVGTEGKDDWGAYVTAERTSTGATLKGATVTIGTAKREGWMSKSGSKWLTMPELMLSYRAYAWFARVYAPELMMGLQSREELEDIAPAQADMSTVQNPYTKVVK